jgi:hypothetical protein
MDTIFSPEVLGRFSAFTDRPGGDWPSSKRVTDPTVLLNRFKSWQLHRISPATYPNDIVVKLSREEIYSQAELAAIIVMLKSGVTYRARIGKRRYFFATDQFDAALAAMRDAVCGAIGDGSDRKKEGKGDGGCYCHLLCDERGKPGSRHGPSCPICVRRMNSPKHKRLIRELKSKAAASE